MHDLTRRALTGLDALAAVTTLLQRIRSAHPTAGLYEAADLQWWWSLPRPTDTHPQLFWFDDQGLPEAAIVATWWRDHVTLDPFWLPDPSPELVAHVMAQGLARAEAAGFTDLALEVDTTDEILAEVLAAHGFVSTGDEYVESWMAADDRLAVSPLHDGYRLATRADTTEHPHHMVRAGRAHDDAEARLGQTSLYRADLDLVVLDPTDAPVAYTLCWYDPVTATGLIEPMRTEDAHQRRGLARHLLTAGVDRLAQAGAARVKICFEPDNPASSSLYPAVGFVPDRQNTVWTRTTEPAT